MTTENNTRDFNWLDELWCVIKEDGTFAGIPCRSEEEAIELSRQHYLSGIYKLNYDWDADPFGFRYIEKNSLV
jgi:hypothetical protein